MPGATTGTLQGGISIPVPTGIAWGASQSTVPQAFVAATAQLGSTNIVVLMSSVVGEQDVEEGLYEGDRRRYAHDVGVQQGREFLENERGLVPAPDWVNPFDNNGSYGQGFDDILVDENGDYWVGEYKGGSSELTGDQMEDPWVNRNIDRLLQHASWSPWGQRLADARAAGRLKGIAVRTGCENGEVGDTEVIGEWTYGGE